MAIPDVNSVDDGVPHRQRLIYVEFVRELAGRDADLGRAGRERRVRIIGRRGQNIGVGLERGVETFDRVDQVMIDAGLQNDILKRRDRVRRIERIAHIGGNLAVDGQRHLRCNIHREDEVPVFRDNVAIEFIDSRSRDRQIGGDDEIDPRQ